MFFFARFLYLAVARPSYYNLQVRYRLHYYPPDPMAPVAIITGASSGIGLALTQYLLSLPTPHWNVVLADLNPPPPSAALPQSRTLFIRTDVASWSQQAHLFRTAFAHFGRLDFAALNAGIDDRDDIFHSLDSRGAEATERGGPRMPSRRTFEVNLVVVYEGVKLAAWYMNRAKPDSPSLSSSMGAAMPVKGRIVITASSAGLYPLAAIPQYTAAKHGLVGLTRALAPTAAGAGMTVNALCPAVVATGLAPPGLLDVFPEEMRTPMSTMMRAFEALGELSEFSEGGGGGTWGNVEKAKNGCTVEVSLQDLWYREPPAFADKGQKYMAKGAEKVWRDVYRVRNKGFAERDWEAEERVEREKAKL